jgi:hypothetical protein
VSLSEPVMPSISTSSWFKAGIPDFFVSTRVRFLIQTPHEKYFRSNEKSSASL